MVRLLVLVSGQRFDAKNLDGWMQIADVALLRDHLWRTLWYLHGQPPLFNLLIGLALHTGPTAIPWVMQGIYAAVTLGGIVAVHTLIRNLTGRAGLALIVGGWLCVSPAVLLFSQKLYYDGLVPWLRCVAFAGPHAGMTRRSGGWLAFGFTMLAATTLLWSMIHPLLCAAILAKTRLAASGLRRKVIALAVVPGAAIAAVMLKNLLSFGSATLRRWAPLNLDRTTVDPLPLAKRKP